MQIREVDFPAALIEAHRARGLVIFVGAGASLDPPSNLVDFRELTVRIAAEAQEQATERDLLRADVFLGKLVESYWRDQFDWMYREQDYGVYAFTIHPDVSGRPQVLLMIERMIEHINGHEGVSWVTMEDAADDFRKRYAFPGAKGSPFMPGSA